MKHLAIALAAASSLVLFSPSSEARPVRGHGLGGHHAGHHHGFRGRHHGLRHHRHFGHRHHRRYHGRPHRGFRGIGFGYGPYSY